MWYVWGNMMEYLGNKLRNSTKTSSVLIKQMQTEQMKSFHLDGVHAGKIYDGTYTSINFN